MEILQGLIELMSCGLAAMAQVMPVERRALTGQNPTAWTRGMRPRRRKRKHRVCTERLTKN